MEDLCRTNSRGLGGESIVSFWQNGGKSPVVVLATDKRGPTIQFFNFLMRRAQPTHPTIRQSDGCTAYRSDVIIHLILHFVCSHPEPSFPKLYHTFLCPFDTFNPASHGKENNAGKTPSLLDNGCQLCRVAFKKLFVVVRGDEEKSSFGF